MVIPAVPCLPLARALPEVRLAVGSNGIGGAEKIYEWTQTGAEAAPAMVLHDPTVAGRTELRSDVLAELRTVDDSCASAWNIELASPGEAIGLENFGGSFGEEGLGTQNRFALDLGRYRGHDYDLQAELAFPGVTVRTTWPIRILPFAAPSAQLTVGDRKLDIVPGCDVQLVLGTGYAELADPCFADLDRLPKTASIRRPGPPLLFRFPAGWLIEGPTVVCGRIDAHRFDEDSSCVVGWSYEPTSLSILDPRGTEDGDDGPWTLAINVCGTEVLNDATNAACGTWYATIEPRAPAK
jgi:hypothetical protein